MKNSIKIMAALKQAFPGHEVTSQSISATGTEHLYLDGTYMGWIDSEIFNQDLDNPEIEITVKASFNNIKNYVDFADDYGIIRDAVERGLAEWEEKSQHKAESEDVPILDKIRANIESQREEISKRRSEDIGLSNYYFGLNDGLKDARDILDKYKAESEGKK